MRDIQGQKFGRLLVIERVKVPGANNAMWKCQCDCGSETVAAAANIGRTTFSCGCLAKERAAEVLRGNKHTMTHGGVGTPEYRCWQLMKRRCYNPNDKKYSDYGGRGIIVCSRWKDSFENFLADMGNRPSPKHSIDRKDFNGDYSPENCRWATPKEQMRNTRRNIMIEINGITRCASEWCEVLGLDRVRIYDQIGIRKGYVKPFPTVEAAIRHFYRQKHP